MILFCDTSALVKLYINENSSDLMPVSYTHLDVYKRQVLPDSKADLLIFGSAERAVVELAHRLAAGEAISDIRDLRGTAFMVPRGWLPGNDWAEVDASDVDTPGALVRHPDPYAMTPETGQDAACAARPAGSDGGKPRAQVIKLDFQSHSRMPKLDRTRTAIRLPSYEQVAADPVLYAHASRTFHVESNPGNARALVQAHGERDVWLNPPPIPLTTPEMDGVFASPFRRRPHPSYGEAKIPAFEMIRFSINIMRGCFGGCTFCSITEHEGRIIQSRSEQSILHEIEEIRDKTPGFTGVISDLGGPTANMYRLACKDPRIESSCRRLSCVFPGICENLDTDHPPLVPVSYTRLRYTADRKPRSDDSYTPNGEANKRPDHAVVVYAQRCREAFPGANVVIGSIEASLRPVSYTHLDVYKRQVLWGRQHRERGVVLQ